MLGANARRKGPFVPPPAFTTPGFGDEVAVAGNIPAGEQIATRLGMFGNPRAAALAKPSAASDAGAGILAPAAPPLSLTAPDEMPTRISAPPSLEPLAVDLIQKKPGFFSKDGAWRDVLGGLADGLAAAGGLQPTYGPNKIRMRQQQAEIARQDELRQQDRQWALEDRDWKAAQPGYFMSGRDRIKYDPTTGATETIYDAPTDFQEYADILGLEPGTDEYAEAMQDYVLRSNGPTAQAGRQELEGLRNSNRLSLEGVRQGNRMALRQTPTYANLHPRPAAAGGSGGGGRGGPPRTTGNVYAPILAKIAAGKQLTPGEQQVIGMYGRGGRGGKAGGSSGGSGPVATDGKGNKVQWNGKSWVPVR